MSFGVPRPTNLAHTHTPAGATRTRAPDEQRRAQGHSRSLPPTLIMSISCSDLVPHPVDDYPVRSSQIVHSTIATILAGREIVEIGTRNGDGMMCFAQVAHAATAIEVDPKYCELLRRRAASAGSSDGTGLFNVTCKRYQDVTVDADYYTWWNQRPHLLNLAVLLQLAHDVSKGKIRSSARALVLSNSPKCSGTETRSESCRLLIPLAARVHVVPFDEEGPSCTNLTRRPRPNTKCFYIGPRSARKISPNGTWTVLEIPLASIARRQEEIATWPRNAVRQ